jgi:phage shock protein C
MSAILFLIILGVATYACHKNGFFISESNKVIGGVCAGIGARFSLAPNLVRVLAVIALLASAGIVGGLYLALWLSLPKR